MYTEASSELVLQAYYEGIFPMADSADSLFYNFYRPDQRGQLSIQALHIPKRLRKTVRQEPYEIKINTDFESVIDACAQENKTRDTTWINKPIRDVFVELHKLGFAHSIEAWQGSRLVGGLYGLALGRVFCGESMFTKATDASKITLVHLAARLWKAGFTILDTQFRNDHLEQFGVYEVPQGEYEKNIETEMFQEADFLLPDYPALQEQDLVLDYFDYLMSHSAESSAG